MYYDYFGFRQAPFKITPDTSLFYPGGDRGAILEALLYAILNGEGIIKVVGEVGSGKTMLCRMLEKELPDKVEVVYLVNPSISPENTLHAIAYELKLGVNTNTSRFEVMNELQQYLLQRHSENRQVVVFVEEAQSMPIATLEEIRLLSNLETQQSKLLQIVLFGQPELDEMISTPEIRQLKERITYSFQLTPFKTNDIREYINTRIRACGYRSGDLFTDAAIKQIEHYSKGLLRRVNILADKSLLAAFADNAHKVSAKHTRMAARDSEFVRKTFWSVSSALIAGSSILIPIIAVVILLRPGLNSTPALDMQDTINPGASIAPAGQPNDSGVTVSLYSDPAEINAVQASQNIASPTGQQDEPDTAPQTQSEPAIVGLIEDPDDISSDTTIADITPIRQEPVIASAADSVQVTVPVTITTATPELTISAPVLQNDLTSTTTADEVSGETTTSGTTAEIELSTKLGEINEFKDNLEEFNSPSPPTEASPDPQQAPETQLLGMLPVYQLQDLGENGLTAGEADELQRQLIRLPPESAENQNPMLDSEICQRCWSIIYRPLPIIKNL